MAATAREREERAARERARVYAARQELHRRQVGRRRRDDVIAGVAGGILVLAIAGVQFAYYETGPGAPAPSDTSTSTPQPTTTDAVSPDPASTDGGIPDPASTPAG
ncbi:dioxygenase [Microbacterium sp. SORGH_AS_0888]|uniref:dioxygenase n=1 Tax=Microbacterium sp. SORGH_AS_0888 TaxID=3041791 RepID=UPI00278B4785|nr:dioxygenase [Microbacterium sp. SORGH_AS_0888]MDQ1128538.1 type II secretory pathway pseudopilin PulG [Microbacterium sp. SORGH_AS_0888]